MVGWSLSDNSLAIAETLFLFTLAVVLSLILPPPAVAPSGDPPSDLDLTSLTDYSSWSLFEENLGQANPDFPFLGHSDPHIALLGREGILLRSHLPGKKTSSMRMELVDSRAEGACVGVGTAGGVKNYLLGNRPENWVTGVHQFHRVRCESVYAHIDLEYYARRGQLEYDFIVKPGGDPREIILEFESETSIQIDSRGNFSLGQGAAEMTHYAPYSYQRKGSERVAVASWFTSLASNRIGFELEDYDPELELIIDPVLVHSTQIGGSGGEFGRSVAVDAQGNTLVAGTSQSGSTFPIVNGSAEGTKPDFAFITKFGPGGELIFSTVLGGTGDDRLLGLAIDAQSQIHVTGWTSSADFPLASAFQTQLRGESDAFLAKLSADGTQLLFSTFLGGSGREDLDKSFFREEPYGGLVVDSSGNIFLTGITSSPDFPVLNPFQPAGNQNEFPSFDLFVSGFTPTGEQIFATYLGGSDIDLPRSIALSRTGEILVVGGTNSADFPLVSPIREELSGEGLSNSSRIVTGEGFLTRIAGDGQSLDFSSYIGGSGDDESVGDVEVDETGRTWVFGHTNSADLFSASPGAVSPAKAQLPTLQTNLKGETDFFLMSLDLPEESAPEGGFFGGSDFELAGRLALDASGGFHFTGSSRSADYPLYNPLQGRLSGGIDIVVTSLQPGLDAVRQSTFLGAGFGSEFGYDIVSAENSIFLTGLSAGGGGGFKKFPVANESQRGATFGRDAFVSRIRFAGGQFLGPFPQEPWSRFVRMDTNANGIPDPADEILSVIRDGEKLTFTSTRWSSRPLFLSDPDPVSGQFRVVARRKLSRYDPTVINVETSARVSAQDFGGVSKLSLTQENRREATVKNGEVELLDTNGDGLVDSISGRGDGIPQVFLSLIFIDSNFDGTPDYVTIPSSASQILGIDTGDQTFDPQVFVPLGDSDGDGTPDRPAFDFDADQIPDPDIPLLATFSGPSLSPQHTIYFAQFGEGLGVLSSQILLFSLASSASRAEVRLLDDNGAPLSVDLNGQTIAGLLTIDIPACGIVSLKTDGLGPLSVGSVRVTADQPIAGVIVFDGSVGLAGVGASPETTTGFAAPMEESAADQIRTGIAVMNLEKEGIRLTITLLDAAGVEVATTTLDLGGNGHRARFLTELFESLDLDDFAGTLIVESEARISATVLQTRPGEFATLPVTPLGRGTRELVFAHFGEGLGLLFSQLQVLNMQENDTEFQASFRDDEGQSLTTDLNGEIVEGSTGRLPLPGRGLSILRTDGLGDLITGSVYVFATPSPQRLAGVLLFGGVVGVAGVGESIELANGFLAPIQSHQGSSIRTGIAVASRLGTTTNIQLLLFDSEGTLLARSEIEVPRLGHRALFADELVLDR